MSSQLSIAVLTTGRQDWGLLRPLCLALKAEPGFSLNVLAGGMACSEAFGCVTRSIRDQGFDVAMEMPWNVESADACVQASDALEMTASALSTLCPDALVLLGDRYETVAAAIAATLRTVPIIHLYGGEETEGVFDNSLRHALTKLSHLHFVSHEVYARRIRQMGEDPSSVHVVGSLAVDNVRNLNLPSRSTLEQSIGLSLRSPVGVVTVHPSTLHAGEENAEVSAVVEAIVEVPIAWVVTLPNADPGNKVIRSRFLELARERDHVVAVTALGEEHYLGLLQIADLMLGNSSSGMTEGPALGVPTVNVGDRQKGRLRCPSIVDVPSDPEAVITAIHRVLSPQFREAIKNMKPLYGNGDSAARILELLKRWIPSHPPRKRFFEMPEPWRRAEGAPEAQTPS